MEKGFVFDTDHSVKTRNREKRGLGEGLRLESHSAAHSDSFFRTFLVCSMQLVLNSSGGNDARRMHTILQHFPGRVTKISDENTVYQAVGLL